MLKNGFLTFCCAFVPGAGQMYQGYMKRGLSLILTACCIGMVSSLLNPVLLLLVVVWMYSFFDTFNLRAQILADTAPEDDYLIHFDPRDRRLARALLDSHKLVGWALIAFGALIAYQSLIMNILGDLVYRWGHSSPVFRHGLSARRSGLCGPHRLRRLAGERPPSGQKAGCFQGCPRGCRLLRIPRRRGRSSGKSPAALLPGRERKRGDG